MTPMERKQGATELFICSIRAIWLAQWDISMRDYPDIWGTDLGTEAASRRMMNWRESTS